MYPPYDLILKSLVVVLVVLVVVLVVLGVVFLVLVAVVADPPKFSQQEQHKRSAYEAASSWQQYGSAAQWQSKYDGTKYQRQDYQDAAWSADTQRPPWAKPPWRGYDDTSRWRR